MVKQSAKIRIKYHHRGYWTYDFISANGKLKMPSGTKHSTARKAEQSAIKFISELANYVCIREER